MTLLCDNCGAVFPDIWPTDEEKTSTMPQPICPHCGRAWYESSEDSPRPPTHAPYLAHTQEEDQPLSEYWKTYSTVIERLTALPGDEGAALTRAIWAANCPNPSLSMLEQQYRQHQALQQQRLDTCLEAMALARQDLYADDPESILIAQQTLETLRAYWDYGNNTGLTLEEAVSLTYPNTKAQRRAYHRVKARLSWIQRLYQNQS